MYAFLLHFGKVLFCNLYLDEDTTPIMEKIYPGPANLTDTSHRSISYETISSPYWAFLLGITVIMHGVILFDIIKKKYPQLHPANIWTYMKIKFGCSASNSVEPELDGSNAGPMGAWEPGAGPQHSQSDHISFSTGSITLLIQSAVAMFFVLVARSNMLDACCCI